MSAKAGGPSVSLQGRMQDLQAELMKLLLNLALGHSRVKGRSQSSSHYSSTVWSRHTRTGSFRFPSILLFFFFFSKLTVACERRLDPTTSPQFPRTLRPIAVPPNTFSGVSGLQNHPPLLPSRIHRRHQNITPQKAKQTSAASEASG